MEESINAIVSNITDLLITPIIYLLVALSMMYFFWGLALFVLNADEPAKRTEGWNHMLWGGAGLFILGSVWGIINAIDATIKTVT